jgi:hypothetical protein
MSDFMQELRADPAFKKYKAIVQLVRGAIDPEKMQSEAITLQKLRKSRELVRFKMSPNKMHDAYTKDMSTRARLTDLKVALYIQSEILNEALSHFKNHFLITYRRDIKEYATTAAEKEALFKRVSRNGQEFKHQLKVAMDVIDFIIADVDKAGFGMTGAKEMVRIVIERPGQVV